MEALNQIKNILKIAFEKFKLDHANEAPKDIYERIDLKDFINHFQIILDRNQNNIEKLKADFCQLLTERWEYIRNTNFSYDVNLHHPINQFCLQLAEWIEPGNHKLILMPTLKNLECHENFRYHLLDEFKHTNFGEFIISKNGRDFINISSVLESTPFALKEEKSDYFYTNQGTYRPLNHTEKKQLMTLIPDVKSLKKNCDRYLFEKEKISLDEIKTQVKEIQNLALSLPYQMTNKPSEQEISYKHLHENLRNVDEKSSIKKQNIMRRYAHIKLKKIRDKIINHAESLPQAHQDFFKNLAHYIFDQIKLMQKTHDKKSSINQLNHFFYHLYLSLRHPEQQIDFDIIKNMFLQLPKVTTLHNFVFFSSQISDDKRTQLIKRCKELIHDQPADITQKYSSQS